MRLSPIGWALRPLKNYANFSGRAPRAEFWWFFLFTMITYFAVVFSIAGGLVAVNPTGPNSFAAFGFLGLFIILFWLVLIVPTIAVQIRRLHDTDHSGWWVGGFWLLYLAYLVLSFGFLASEPSGNPNPTLGLAGTVMVVALVFFIYSIVLLVFFCMRGTEGTNRFGDDPYGANIEEVFA